MAEFMMIRAGPVQPKTAATIPVVTELSVKCLGNSRSDIKMGKPGSKVFLSINNAPPCKTILQTLEYSNNSR